MTIQRLVAAWSLRDWFQNGGKSMVVLDSISIIEKWMDFGGWSRMYPTPATIWALPSIPLTGWRSVGLTAKISTAIFRQTPAQRIYYCLLLFSSRGLSRGLEPWLSRLAAAASQPPRKFYKVGWQPPPPLKNDLNDKILPLIDLEKSINFFFFFNWLLISDANNANWMLAR
jgi:hypothetical protein